MKYKYEIFALCIVVFIVICCLTGETDEVEEKVRTEQPKVKTTIPKDPVVQTNAPYSTTNLSVKQINKMLHDTGLKNYGKSFAELEKQHGINAIYAVAVMRLESGLGYKCPNTNNLFAIRGTNGYVTFPSFHDSISHFGELMNTDLYKGKSLPEISQIYCENADWYIKIEQIMNELWLRIN